VAPNIPLVDVRVARADARSCDGPLRIVFLARIVPMKNLEGALRAFARVREPATLDIFGPIEDESYWKRCQALVDSLPAHLRASHHGVVNPEDVEGVLAGYDLYLLPSLGENFGVSIFEALAAGVPVLISDRTPWRDLETAGAGWDVPLNDELEFARRIDGVAAMDARGRMALSEGATRLAAKVAADSERVELNRRLFGIAARRDVGDC
jgi:glycosyltransferase involved in cell wall biosynthesis